MMKNCIYTPWDCVPYIETARMQVRSIGNKCLSILKWQGFQLKGESFKLLINKYSFLHYDYKHTIMLQQSREFLSIT